MINMKISFDDIKIESIEKKDIYYIQKWFNYQQLFYDIIEKPLNLDEFYERFLEYYLSEGEFFFKILKEDKFIGILKGRVEYRNPNEVWISCLMLDKNYRSCGIGSSVIESFLYHLKTNYDIKSFYTGVVKGNDNSLKFWKKMNFNVHRVAKEFYNSEGKNEDMIILKRS